MTFNKPQQASGPWITETSWRHNPGDQWRGTEWQLPTNSAESVARRQWRVRGILAHTLRHRPPAAERRFRTFLPSSENGEIRPTPASSRAALVIWRTSRGCVRSFWSCNSSKKVT